MFEGLVETYGVLGLFLAAFISSTIAPGGSEAVLALLILNSDHQPIYLVLIATIGNTLGALTTFYLGHLVSTKYSAKNVNPKYFNKANELIQRYGSVALLLSWLPLLGDVLCLVAGWVRLNIIKSIIFITIGKFARYFLISLMLN
ncbi:MAG: DedA family protein [Cycloclasticus sp.]|nr:DedA family protein [Cycloclasticus sp.]